MIKTTLKIDGMACGMCEAHINDVIRQDIKVKKVTSKYKKNETVIISEEALDEEKLRKTIANTGYILIEIKSEPYEKKGLFNK